MKRLITTLTVILSCSTVCAQIDAGHSMLRNAAFSNSGGCADGSCGMPASYAANYVSLSSSDYSGGGCADGSCALRSNYSQAVTPSYGGCADGSCSLNVARGGSIMSRVAGTQIENKESTAVASTTATGQYYSDSFPTSYLEDATAATEYTNHIVIIRRTPDVESHALNAVGEPLASFSAVPNK